MNDLTDDNFIMFAMKAYNSPLCVMSEFEEDLKRVKYIKRLIKRYTATGNLKERLILNHIIILGNVFSVEFAVRMLFFKLDYIDYKILKTFLLFLNYMQPVVRGIRGLNIYSAEVGVDLFVGKRLRDI